MVVGDDDQSIYRFRGARIENILSFERHFDDASVIRLEQNYRSTSNILNAANAVIANNTGRMGKTLRTDRGEGEKIHLKRLENQNEEAQFIINRIAELVMREKRRFSDFAVLYRVNAQSNSLENVFARSGIPYRVLGGMRFFERKEIKDILAYLCVINNPNDSLRLKRIINEPKRKIGETTVSTVEAIAEKNGIGMFDVMENAARYDSLVRVAPKLKEFTDIINELRGIAENESIPVVVEKTIDMTGYRQMILMMGDSELDRLENLREFVSTAIDYEDRIKEAAKEREKEAAAASDGDLIAAEYIAELGEDIYDDRVGEELRPTLTGFLEEVALVADIDGYDADADAVSLMTVHSAKGLEFPVVFLPGFEDGIFPGMQATYSDEELEEERRLAYVALTRAKDRVYISHTRERLIYGRTMHNYISRFVDEIPKEFVFSSFTQRRTDGEKRGNTTKPKTVLSSEMRGDERTGGAKTEKAVSFKAGDAVTHVTFGRGEIITATPMGGDVLYEVIFESVGTKKLMGKYARLKTVEA